MGSAASVPCEPLSVQQREERAAAYAGSLSHAFLLGTVWDVGLVKIETGMVFQQASVEMGRIKCRGLCRLSSWARHSILYRAHLSLQVDEMGNAAGTIMVTHEGPSGSWNLVKVRQEFTVSEYRKDDERQVETRKISPQRPCKLV